jgi:uncharacterized damage-inducible protein DinB
MINKPQPGEYSPYAQGYIDRAAAHGDVLQLLTNLMDTSVEFFAAIPADKQNYSYAPGKWTIKQVLGHLIDTERIFAYRALCIARGETKNLPGFEQDDYEASSPSNDREMIDLIAEFNLVRLANLYFLRSLTTEQADRVGLSNNTATSVRALVHMMAGHELYHLEILKERYL